MTPLPLRIGDPLVLYRSLHTHTGKYAGPHTNPLHRGCVLNQTDGWHEEYTPMWEGFGQAHNYWQLHTGASHLYYLSQKDV